MLPSETEEEVECRFGEKPERMVLSSLPEILRSVPPISVRYKNYAGMLRLRQVIPTGAPFFGSNEWHPEPQWLLPVVDVDSGEERTFALKNCDFSTVG